MDDFSGRIRKARIAANAMQQQVAADECEWLALYRALPKNRRRALLKSMSVFLRADDGIPPNSESESIPPD